jgi:hypothetical protein
MLVGRERRLGALVLHDDEDNAVDQPHCIWGKGTIFDLDIYGGF